MKQVVNELLMFLKNKVPIKNGSFVAGFVCEEHCLGNDEIIVAGKIGKVKCKEEAMGAYLGGRQSGKKVELTLDFCIYAGKKKTAMDCENLFADIMEQLMICDNSLYIKEMTSEKVSYEDDGEVLRLPFNMKVDYYVTKEHQTIAIDEFLVRSVYQS